MEDLIELCRSDACYSCLLIDHTFLKHIHCHIEGSKTGSLTYAALKHPKLAVLDSELDVLHVTEVVLKVETDAVEFLVDLRH